MSRRLPSSSSHIRRARWNKDVGMEMLLGQPGFDAKVLFRGGDHQRVAAGVNLHPRKIGVILEHGPMDWPRTALPVIGGLGQHRHERESVRARSPLLYPVEHVEIGARASA